MSEELVVHNNVIVASTMVGEVTADNRPKVIQVLADIREELRSIDKQRKHLLAPALETQRRINGEARKASSVLEAENDRITKLVEAYDTTQRRRIAQHVAELAHIINNDADRLLDDALKNAESAMTMARDVLRQAEDDYRTATEHGDEAEQLSVLERVMRADAEVSKAQEEVRILEQARVAAIGEINLAQRMTTTGSDGAVSVSIAKYRYELDDITKVPEAYLVPPEERLDRAKLAALSRGSRRPQFIPGLRIVEGSSIRTRT